VKGAGGSRPAIFIDPTDGGTKKAQMLIATAPCGNIFV
jgi:hypothetical protein